ncbi:SMC-Scp complex subunit ScpB [Candidatus Kaiserbacteria bacterium]|nr:SMC-Scp complex subunit ScpB [Candidatus Kaiserbacteria bacterium]
MPSESSTPPARDLVAQAEAFLFVEGGTLSLKALAAKLRIETIALGGVLDELATRFNGRGLTLIRTETEVSLAVAPMVSGVIEAAYAQDKEIGDAGLEVLAIILYCGASTKSRIDYIRGVNTGSTIRTLLSRGLIERAGNPADSREYLYRPSTELLAHLGVARVEDLPNYGTIYPALLAFEAQKQPLDGSNHGATTTTDTTNTDHSA